MSDEQQPCAREDLRAEVEAVAVYAIDKDGEPVRWLGDEPEPTMIVGYVCANCDQTFVPEELRHQDIERAWQSALDHLPVNPKQEQAA